VREAKRADSQRAFEESDFPNANFAYDAESAFWSLLPLDSRAPPSRAPLSALRRSAASLLSATSHHRSATSLCQSRRRECLELA
jgi:hypothetical protein